MRILALLLSLSQLFQLCNGSCPTIGAKEENNEEGRRLCATVYEVSVLFSVSPRAARGPFMVREHHKKGVRDIL